jgi:ribosomal protein S18 acetylase RimI-like enzyme
MSEIGSNVRIRTLTLDDLLISMQIFEIHSKSMPFDVMPSFGARLHSRYLMSLLRQDGQIFVAEVYNSVVGFLALRMNNSTRFLLPQLQEMGVFIRNSIQVPRLVANLCNQIQNRIWLKADSVEIEYFAVKEQYRGKGIGHLLVSEASKYALQFEKKCMMTKTNNHALRNYYLQRHQAQQVHQFKSLNQEYFILTWNLEQN